MPACMYVRICEATCTLVQYKHVDGFVLPYRAEYEKRNRVKTFKELAAIRRSTSI